MIRKILVSAVALFALMVATAQAHTASFGATCGTASFSWTAFGTSGNGNGGQNSPHWALTFTPTLGSVVTKSGQVSFPGASFALDVTIPDVNGTVAMSSTWAVNETRDGNASSGSRTVTISNCAKHTPALSTTASPSSAAVGSSINDVAHLTGGSSPTGTITWKLYGPNDTNCTAANPPTVSSTVNGANDYTSPALTPSTAGTYQWVASYSGDTNNVALGPVGCSDSNETVTITKVTPALSTSASPASAPVGTAINDIAHLTGGDHPTGTITWKLYGPNDSSCASASPLTTTAVTVNGAADYTSPALTPSTAGTYHWVATYSGDSNNVGLGPVGCIDPNETVTITQVTPGLTTTASPATAAVGTAINDIAHLTGGNHPTGTITWKLYGPNDAGCTSPTPLATAGVTVNGAGDYTSPALTPSTAGTYHWVATYSGDTNNAGLGPVGCTDASEKVTITPVTPALSTTATPASAPVGTAINDIAHLTGGDHPTGTITWKLYGPGDDSCSSANPATTTAVTVNGAGDYTSPALTPTVAGTYHWVASYSGDTNNVALGPVGCTDPNETVTIKQLTPGLTTTATPANAGVGTPIRDVAHLTGGDHPTGTITWALYGPNDATCSAATPPTTAPVSVTGAGDYTSPTLTPTTAGTYHWVATYSGDTNNVALGPVGCTDPAEAVTLTPGPSPSFTMVKLEAVDGSNTPFVRGPITAQIGQMIDYQIQVTNTGNLPLALSLADVKCTNIRGPVGNIDGSGDLAVGGSATYTCSHVVVAADAPQYVNSGTITGTPPGGPPLPPQTSSVLANIPQQGVLCFATTSQLHLATTTARNIFTATLKVPGPANTVKSVTFTLDGRTVATLGRPNGPNGTYRLRVTVRRSAFRRHNVAAHVNFTCGPAKIATAGYQSPARKVTPHFTG